jgi:hypothetical protein
VDNAVELLAPNPVDVVLLVPKPPVFVEALPKRPPDAAAGCAVPKAGFACPNRLLPVAAPPNGVVLALFVVPNPPNPVEAPAVPVLAPNIEPELEVLLPAPHPPKPEEF